METGLPGLTWDDFKQRPDASSLNAALTSSSIKFNFRYGGNNLEFHIQCAFDKSSSWGRKSKQIISFPTSRGILI